MSLSPSKSVSRVKEGYIYGWSPRLDLTSGGVELLSYNNPADFYLTRLMFGLDFSGMSAGQVLSLSLQVDGQLLFAEKHVLSSATLGVQPKQLEFVISPNTLVEVVVSQGSNQGSASAILTGYKV